MKIPAITIVISLILLNITACKKPEAIGIIDVKVGMRLREGPGISTRQIGYIPNRAKIKIYDLNGPEETLYGIKSRWYKVEYAEVSGWMFGGFVKLIKEKPKKDKIIGIIDTMSGMRLREGPSTSTKKLMVIPHLSQIAILDMNGPVETIYGIKSRWYKVEYKGKRGWMFGGFVKVLSDKKEIKRIQPKPSGEDKKGSIGENSLPEEIIQEEREITTDIDMSKVGNCIRELLRSYHGDRGKTLAVFPYKGRNVVKPQKISMINTIITRNVFNDSRFKVIERENLSSIIKEQELQQTGLTSQATEVGKIAGAEMLLIYRIQDGILNFRIVDTTTAQVMAFSGLNLME